MLGGFLLLFGIYQFFVAAMGLLIPSEFQPFYIVIGVVTFPVSFLLFDISKRVGA